MINKTEKNDGIHLEVFAIISKIVMEEYYNIENESDVALQIGFEKALKQIKSKYEKN